MEMERDDQQPALLHAEPVLPVTNVIETVAYWHEVLGFSDKWIWGDPPNHGGVGWHGAAFVQFSLDPKRDVNAQGHALWVRVRNLEALYAIHRKKANVIAPLENKPWGLAEYTVRELNGHYLKFSAPYVQEKAHEKFPDTIRIIPRCPNGSEHLHLLAAAGWATAGDSVDTESLMASAVYGVVAENVLTHEVVGCALLFGDNKSFYYVKDVIVHPKWQARRIGTALMQEITRWLEINAPEKAIAGLFTGEHLVNFYRQFGFKQACGMYREIKR
jgi:GNAT superfamily N-acetyltransferase